MNAMLTMNGYRLQKADVDLPTLKRVLTVKPSIPSVFVNPRYVTSYPVYQETESSIYVPKQYGITTYGVPSETSRDVPETSPEFWSFNGSIRPEQREVVDSFLQPTPHDGIISLQTGGGKTVCALYIAAQLRLPTIVLVHNTFLRDQWAERIGSFLPNARLGKIQADVHDVENKDIVIAMLQTVSMREIPVATFKSFGLVVVDECHHIASEVFFQALPKMTSRYMLGLSATPTRKDGLMNVAHWFLGPLLYVSDSGDKEDPKIRVEVFEYVNTDPVFNKIEHNSQGVMAVPTMINKLAECTHRTEWIVGMIEDILETEPNRQILVLSDRVEHVKTIVETLSPRWKETACALLQTVKAPQRAEFCLTKRVLVATYAMCKEGFDVPTLNTLVMSTPRPDIDQIVGRILRVEKSKRMIHPLIVDIVDPQFRRQFSVRNQLYSKRKYGVVKVAILPEPTK